MGQISEGLLDQKGSTIFTSFTIVTHHTKILVGFAIGVCLESLLFDDIKMYPRLNRWGRFRKAHTTFNSFTIFTYDTQMLVLLLVLVSSLESLLFDDIKMYERLNRWGRFLKAHCTIG